MKPLLQRGRDDNIALLLLGLGVTLAVVPLAEYLVSCFTRRNSTSTSVFKSLEDDGDVISSQEMDQPSVPELEEEFVHPTHLVRPLWKQERNNEIRLLECYGVEERETTVRELKNWLQICSMAAESLSVKLEFLEVENQRLQSCGITELGNHATASIRQAED
ncbi:hypothetical protein BHE74_00007207 [Ensete ventricosum]|nr:hypothetical protein GW17_00027453 [Ensete ventricosum]RWW84198.1 hypothetical protein BHE74_00007207 [Ensete ventricosum]RZR89399.1 hypothetical protein BHM03_00017113 [Ensete ventricosum]